MSDEITATDYSDGDAPQRKPHVPTQREMLTELELQLVEQRAFVQGLVRLNKRSQQELDWRRMRLATFDAAVQEFERLTASSRRAPAGGTAPHTRAERP
jgi:hypothetical protein